MKKEIIDKISYVTILNAWYKARFELDKYLLTLSSAGAGLLLVMLTLISTITISTAIMYSLAGLSFLVCIVCIICGYPRSLDYLEEVIRDIDEDTPDDQITICLNKIAFTSFIFGTIFTSLIGLSLIIGKLY